MRNLSISSKTTVFKTFAISKIVHLALVKVIHGTVIHLYHLRPDRTIISQIIWYNKCILVGKRSFYNTTLARMAVL